jgi:CotS family spore coat protein
LDIKDIKALVEINYNLKILSIEKIKNVYKIQDVKKKYCLKVIKYEFSHFLFIISAIQHLQSNGFMTIPTIYKTAGGSSYIKINTCYAYLTPWVEARECNYDNPVEVEIAAQKLAELHLKSEGFEVTEYMRPRIGWLKWPVNFSTRRDEILDFKRRIQSKDRKSEFDNIYMQHMEEELRRVDSSLDHLSESQYLHKMTEEISKKGFCHHDYAHHNVLLDNNGRVYIIDFDYTILDSHLHDLASLLIRRMKNGKWDIDNALQVMDAYNSVNKVEGSDIPIMAAFMEFPQDYWQVGIQYYWEKQPWGEEFFLKKLRRIIEDSDEKQEFIDEFRELRYRG